VKKLLGGHKMTRDIAKANAMAIRTAIKQGNAGALRELLGGDKATLEMDTPFGSWLHVAASQNQLDLVKMLLSLGMDVNRKGGILGGTPLNEAASDGHTDIVRYLLANGATLDASDPRLNPLFGAIHGGYTDVAKVLLESGIDADITYNGETMKDMDALAFAREWGRKDIADLITERRQKGAT
jgi:ankyrin repeat protein